MHFRNAVHRELELHAAPRREEVRRAEDGGTALALLGRPHGTLENVLTDMPPQFRQLAELYQAIDSQLVIKSAAKAKAFALAGVPQRLPQLQLQSPAKGHLAGAASASPEPSAMSSMSPAAFGPAGRSSLSEELAAQPAAKRAKAADGQHQQAAAAKVVSLRAPTVRGSGTGIAANGHLRHGAKAKAKAKLFSSAGLATAPLPLVQAPRAGSKAKALALALASSSSSSSSSSASAASSLGLAERQKRGAVALRES